MFEFKSENALSLQGHISALINKEPSLSVIEANTSFYVEIPFEISGTAVPMLAGTFHVQVLFESIGPGPDLEFGPIDAYASSPTAPSDARKYTAQVAVPEGLRAGVYSLIAVVFYKNPSGNPGPIAGYSDQKIIQVLSGDKTQSSTLPETQAGSPKKWPDSRNTDASVPSAKPSSTREITVTSHTIEGKGVDQFKEGEIYLLRFSVCAPTAQNLASGDTEVRDIPKGGLQTLWVVTSTDVVFVPELSSGKVKRVGNTWRAEFELLIPETESSNTQEVGIQMGENPGNMLLTIYSVSARGEREAFREVTISLSGRPVVKVDETFKSPQYTHLKTTHEWTTPLEHIQVSIRDGMAEISTKRIYLEPHEFSEPFAATDTHLSGAINNVREELEKFREAHGNYLDDLDPIDLKARLVASGAWQPHYNNKYGWQPLPEGSNEKHKAAFALVQQSEEWRRLAQRGHELFRRCFPEKTRRRTLLEKLMPGSRIDFHWTEQSGNGWVSHVPWALMYMEPVGIVGQAPPEPEKFLGLRFRIGTRSWSVDNGSVALGGLDTAHAMHLLYWGNKPNDEVAVESQWQAEQYRSWQHSRLVPDPAQPSMKMQILQALDIPKPSPMSLLYFYCHCRVGNGTQPVLQFGNTSQPEDIVEGADLPQTNIPDGPIIFANACTTAQADAHMTNELEQTFFGRGARAFIGTETKVPVILASKFAWLFFQFFYRRVDPDPMAVGEALTQARIFLWTQYKNVGGLFYSLTNQYDLYLASVQEVIALRRRHDEA